MNRLVNQFGLRVPPLRGVFTRIKTAGRVGTRAGRRLEGRPRTQTHDKLPWHPETWGPQASVAFRSQVSPGTLGPTRIRWDISHPPPSIPMVRSLPAPSNRHPTPSTPLPHGPNASDTGTQACSDHAPGSQVPLRSVE
eukprot:2569920-Rhodomonas_salina.3